MENNTETSLQDQALNLIQRGYEVRGNSPYDANLLTKAGKSILKLQEELRHLKSVSLGIECIAVSRMTQEDYAGYEKSKLAVSFQELIKGEQ